jgi:hypothetical protein
MGVVRHKLEATDQKETFAALNLAMDQHRGDDLSMGMLKQ